MSAAPALRGSLWMLVAGLLFAGMGVFVKLGGGHFSSPELVFYRSLFGSAAIFGVVLSKGQPVRSPYWKVHVSRSLIGLAGMLLLFFAIRELPLSTATTLNYTSPLFLVLLSAVVLRQRIRLATVVAVVLGFVGVVLLLHPAFSAEQTLGGLLGLASGFCAGVAYLTTKHLGSLGEPGWRVVLYFTLVSLLVCGVWTLVTGFHSFGLLGLGVCGTGGQLCMTRAYHEGDTLTVGSLAYSTVVFTTLLSIVLWHETVPLSSWLAIGLIVVSGIAAVRTGAGRDVAPAA